VRQHRKRIILVEKTDRLYRNLKDYLTIDELDLELHFIKENIIRYWRIRPCRMPG